MIVVGRRREGQKEIEIRERKQNKVGQEVEITGIAKKNGYSGIGKN